MRKQFDLLAVKGDDTDLAFRDARPDERLGKMADQRGFDFVLDEVAHARVAAGHPVGVDEDGFAADERLSALMSHQAWG